jgi:pyroglutamyl-peptidase
MRRVLLTGFGAYAEEADNPSGAIAARLDGSQTDGVVIHGLVLPVKSARVGATLREAIARISPDVVLVTGVTPGRAAVSVERVAINAQDFPIPDVDGLEPVDEPVVEGGPSAYFSQLPIKAILSAWRARRIPAYVSNSAGTYVCNQTFYLARHLTEGTKAIAGLVHIPLSSSNAAGVRPPPPSLHLDMLEAAVHTAAIVAATHRGPDLRLGAGSTS